MGLLKQFAINSITHSILDDETRTDLMAKWNRRWDAYVLWLSTQTRQSNATTSQQ